MAKTKGALFSQSARGKIGALVIEEQKSGQYIKSKSVKKHIPTTKQKEKRRVYGQAIQAWRALPADLKEVFNIKASLLNISGFNLFVKYFTTWQQIAIYGIGTYGVNNYGK